MSFKVEVKIKPGAKKDKINIEPGNKISVYVTSRPVEGKANGHLIKLIAKKVRIAKSDITIVKGEKSRDKLLEISNITQEEFFNKLNTQSKD